jgi:hypothetical protein
MMPMMRLLAFSILLVTKKVDLALALPRDEDMHAPSISLSKLRCLLQDRLDEAFIAPNKIPSHGK